MVDGRFPFRSCYPLYLFCSVKAKKDAATVAALKQLYAISDVKQFNKNGFFT